MGVMRGLFTIKPLDMACWMHGYFGHRKRVGVSPKIIKITIQTSTSSNTTLVTSKKILTAAWYVMDSLFLSAGLYMHMDPSHSIYDVSKHFGYGNQPISCESLEHEKAID